MTRDKDINSDDQVAPDRVGSSAAEGGASAGGGFGVGLGVVDSRLPPHTKPPTHHKPGLGKRKLHAAYRRQYVQRLHMHRADHGTCLSCCPESLCMDRIHWYSST